MVLPPTTPDHSRYEAGKGHVLSHFAELATPSAPALDAHNARVAAMRTRRNLDAVAADLPTGSAGSFSDSFNVDTHSDRDMEDALFGTRRSDSNNDDELSRQALLDRWRLEKQSVGKQPPKRSKPSPPHTGGSASNQRTDSDRSMFRMDFSPPSRRNRSASSSRRSTVELDAAATRSSEDGDKVRP